MNKSLFRPSPGLWSSLGLHTGLAALLVFGIGLRLRPTAQLRMPGTHSGERTLLSYSPGGQPRIGETAVPTPPAPRRTPPRLIASRLATPAPVPSVPQQVEAGPGANGPSGLGDGDIKIALPQFNPRPQPDLSSLPHGTSGNVVVDVVIDTGGKVTQLTLVKGLNSAIDNTVLQTVHTWVFTPATKDGQVIASEQEILVHYERG